jgi:uncharacterized protein (TIGR00255 family)
VDIAKQPSALNSMTGFARRAGQWRTYAWVWELKSVNGKALDVRFRLPPGFDSLEASARGLLAAKLKRGNIQVSLQLQSSGSQGMPKINAELLDQLIAVADRLRERLGSPPVQAESLLSLRGVLETDEEHLSEQDIKERDSMLLSDFEQCVRELVDARQAEGRRLYAVLEAQLFRVAELTEAARTNPARSVENVRARLGEQVARLVEQFGTLDPQRLHQEAIMLATRADIQEELDRLTSHIVAARSLLASQEPVGRKFDFLAQEFNREANTLCSKANDPSLTAIGLDLKTVIDQMREQVQNIE